MTSLYILELLRVHATFNLPKGQNEKGVREAEVEERTALQANLWEHGGNTNVCFTIRFSLHWGMDSQINRWRSLNPAARFIILHSEGFQSLCWNHVTLSWKWGKNQMFPAFSERFLIIFFPVSRTSSAHQWSRAAWSQDVLFAQVFRAIDKAKTPCEGGGWCEPRRSGCLVVSAPN